MGRDYTKYSIDGGNSWFGKGRFVREIVIHYMRQYPKTSFADLERAFPSDLQGSLGVVRNLEYVNQYRNGHPTDPRRRFFDKEDDVLKTFDGIRFCVCSGWDLVNFSKVLDRIKQWNWKILTK